MSRFYETLCFVSILYVWHTSILYSYRMPKLWTATIDAHRQEVRDTIMETTAALVTKQGLHAVTMSQIAYETGIGRATLYKYFPDIEAILVSRHERHVADHLNLLTDVARRATDASERLHTVLEALALIVYGRAHHSGTEIAALVHRKEHIAKAEQRLRAFIENLLDDCRRARVVRSDVPAGELARYCLHALSAAGGLSSRAAVRRLVAITLRGLSATG